MTVERVQGWETKIKAKPGQEVGPTFFMSDAEPIKGFDRVTVRYLVVSEGDSSRLDPGVYVKPNVTVGSYNGNPSLRDSIGLHVTVDLMDESKKPPSIAGAPHYTNVIELKIIGEDDNGAPVLKVTPLSEVEARQRVNDVESGRYKMRVKLNPPTSS